MSEIIVFIIVFFLLPLVSLLSGPSTDIFLTVNETLRAFNLRKKGEGGGRAHLYEFSSRVVRPHHTNYLVNTITK